MKILSWLTTCSSSVSTTASAGAHRRIPRPETTTLSLSDTSSSSLSLSQETNSSISSLQSNASLLTLPSVPSLQNLSPETLRISVTAHPAASLKPHAAAPITSLAVHNRLLYAASGNEINVFETTENYALVHTFNAKCSSSGSVKSICFTDGKILTAHQDCKIRVWKFTREKRHALVATLPTVEDRLRNVIFPGSYVNVRRHRKKLWVEHHDAVSGLATSDSVTCSVSWDRSLKIWKGPTRFRCAESVRRAHEDAINAVVLAKDGTIFTGSADRRINVWGKPLGGKKHALIASLEKHKSAVNALALTYDDSVLFSGACDRSILVWEREDSANYMVVTGALRGHSKAILCLINVSDLLFSGSADRTVRIWQRGFGGQAGQYCCLTVLDGHEKPVRSLTALTDGGDSDGNVKVFSGSFDGEIKMWQVVISSNN